MRKLRKACIESVQIINAFESILFEGGHGVISWASLTVRNGICTNGGHNEANASVVKSQDRFSSARNYKLRIDRVIILEKITLDLWILFRRFDQKNDIFTSFRGSAVYVKTLIVDDR